MFDAVDVRITRCLRGEGEKSNLELCIYYATVCVGEDGVKKGELSV